MHLRNIKGEKKHLKSVGSLASATGICAEDAKCDCCRSDADGIACGEGGELYNWPIIELAFTFTDLLSVSRVNVRLS